MLFALMTTLGLSVWGQLRVGTFKADVTPPLGQPLIWVMPATKIEDPLLAKGVVLEDRGQRYVLCAVDWCGLSNRSYRLLRDKVAQAAGTTYDRVALQTLHQHTAPYVDGDAYALLEQMGRPVVRFEESALVQIADRLAEAVKKATGSMKAFDSVGTSEAGVERVASARRLPTPDGKVVIRFSTDGKKPEMAAAPEGPIDRSVRTVTLGMGRKPLVRLHYYATHPQTWCCDGRVSADFVGAAREQLEREEGVFQVYFTGAAGDVTVGKYNDSSVGKRTELAERMLAGLRKSDAATQWAKVKELHWKSLPLELPKKLASQEAVEARLAEAKATEDEAARYRLTIAAAFGMRSEPLSASLLSLGAVRIVHLPGEPMLEFQRFAQVAAAGHFVAVAGYGDISPGYLCTDRAYEQGGYEPGASNTTKGAESVIKHTLRELLGSRAPTGSGR
ncbi:hypothetical protein [Paludibaculum fermentans]|uniref:Neutral/alkaline non-lysosomal ceramidase N-terminal domain-containing protein n=1 Tax=Paludibaculum fermentans TaxID=1473598 RepID=A0A7S7NPP6_PALFE|nr:hypothetical protein [Paludibaculum fermentans]QOY87506.1 hypothetical protein IRI77_32920 [Paludibaculum fermentans]